MRWVIGDIHGMRRPLEALVREVLRRDRGATFYFTGDYCDRGPDTRGVVDVLLPMVDEGIAVCVRGNHDDVFDMLLNGHSFAGGSMLGGPARRDEVLDIARAFWNEGLLETILSYGGDLAEVGPLIGNRPAIDAWMMRQVDRVSDDHRRFFRDLPGYAEEDEFFVVHGSWPPDYPDKPDAFLEREPHLRHEVIWGRYAGRQITCDKGWKRRCFVGHTPVDNYRFGTALPGYNGPPGQPGDVIFGNRLVLCDTAAFSPGGRLSAVCHETNDVVQVHHSGEVLR